MFEFPFDIFVDLKKPKPHMFFWSHMILPLKPLWKPLIQPPIPIFSREIPHEISITSHFPTGRFDFIPPISIF